MTIIIPNMLKSRVLKREFQTQFEKTLHAGRNSRNAKAEFELTVWIVSELALSCIFGSVPE